MRAARHKTLFARTATFILSVLRLGPGGGSGNTTLAILFIIDKFLT